MKKNETMVIKITNKGAVVGISMFGNVLIGILNSKRYSKSKTLEDVKDDMISQIKKSVLWLDRKDDNTATQEEIKFAKKQAKEAIKMTEKLWNEPVI